MRAATNIRREENKMKVNPEAELAAKLALIRFDGTKNAHQIAYDAGLLCGLARSHNRLMETACNRELTPRENKRVTALRTVIDDVLAFYIGRGKTKFDGDPRGYTVKIHFPDGRGNTFGGDSEGWGI